MYVRVPLGMQDLERLEIVKVKMKDNGFDRCTAESLQNVVLAL